MSARKLRLLSDLNLVHILTPYLLTIHLILSSHLRLDLPGCLFPLGFSAKISSKQLIMGYESCMAANFSMHFYSEGKNYFIW
jgi:hypothetical protein